jgi:hypothetical protein
MLSAIRELALSAFSTQTPSKQNVDNLTFATTLLLETGVAHEDSAGVPHSIKGVSHVPSLLADSTRTAAIVSLTEVLSPTAAFAPLTIQALTFTLASGLYDFLKWNFTKC